MGVVISATVAQSQEELVQLIFAETVKDAEGETSTTTAVGSVHFKHRETHLYCDSAVFFRAANRVYAYGNVHVNQGDTINLFGDSLQYDGNTALFKLQGNVRMRDNEYKLVTSSLRYSAKAATGTYLEGATITGIRDELTLTSVKGNYHTKTKVFFFKDSVRLIHPNYALFADTLEFRTLTKTAHFHGPTKIVSDSGEIHCVSGVYDTHGQQMNLWNGAVISSASRTFFADSMVYDQIAKVGEGFGNVHLYDSTEQLQFLADYLWKSADSDTLLLKKNAVVVRYQAEDTTFLAADTIRYHRDTLKGKAHSIAQNNVHFISGDLRLKCDSAYFSEPDSIVKLHQAPIAWSQQTQLAADSIHAVYYDNAFHQFDLYQHAFICSEHDTLHYDQIKGEQMTAWIDSNKLRKVAILSGTRSLYYTSEQKTDSLAQTIEKLSGMNDIECNRMHIYFVQSKIERILFLDEPEAIYTPVDQIAEKNLFLKGFQWQIALKPKRPLIKLPESKFRAHD